MYGKLIKTILNNKESYHMDKNTIINKILEYIENHLEEDLTLELIAKELNYSKYYIARTFAKHTKCTIYKYIQGRRLTLAAKKLVETDKSIVNIAYEAHYSSQQAFTLAFRQLYLCSPQVYRKNGIYFPKQHKLCFKNSFIYFSYIKFMSGGKIAA